MRDKYYAEEQKTHGVASLAVFKHGVGAARDLWKERLVMLIKKDLPRLAPNKPEYPTDDQMATLFNAWKKGGKKALGETLDKMHPRTQETPKP